MCPSTSKGLQCGCKVSTTIGACKIVSTNALKRIKLCETNGHAASHKVLYWETCRVSFGTNKTDVFIVYVFHIGVSTTVTIEHVEGGYE